MKAILSILLCCACAVGAEYVNVRRVGSAKEGQPFIVRTNESVKVAFHDFNDPLDRVDIQMEGHHLLSWSIGTLTAKNPVIVGPATITIKNYDAPEDTPQFNSLLTLEMIRHPTQTSITTPSTAVVIPEDATGLVQIILESSTDLVNWTAANPGTYGASTSKRFFRVRAVKQ